MFIARQTQLIYVNKQTASVKELQRSEVRFFLVIVA